MWMNPIRGYVMIVMFIAACAPKIVMAQDEPPVESPPEDGAEETQPVTYASLIDNGNEKVEASYIGLTGGILLGAEAVMIVEGALKVKKVWPYVVMPLFGAGAGGVGGYFLEQNSPGGAIALLVVGVALIIPTAILVKSGRAYNPEEEQAVGADMEGGAKYSFEENPEETAPKDETTTEVERRPPNAPAPGPTSRREIRDGSGQIRSPRARAHDLRHRRLREARSASLRRATAGSLLFVDRDGSAGLSMPRIDISSTYFEPEAAQPGRLALRVYVPLLRVDLP
jgi:hypothetical protein